VSLVTKTIIMALVIGIAYIIGTRTTGVIIE
jgi:hypothetical protein